MRYFHTIMSFLVIAVVLLAAGCSRTDAGASARLYDMGQKVNAGHIVYTVYETQWLTQLGEGTAARIPQPQNRFFLVRISATNSGSADEMIPTFTVEDDKGNSYTEQSNGEGVPQWVGLLRQVKPAESAQGNVIFEAPPKHYRMRVTDENGENAALIDMPLKFEAETPDVPYSKPEQENTAPIKKQ